MKQDKACRSCRYVLEKSDKQKAAKKHGEAKKEETAEVCPVCGSNQFTTFWRGYTIILNPEKSEVAQKMGITKAGKYALRLSR